MENLEEALKEMFRYEQTLPKPMSPIGFVRYCKTHDYRNYCEGIIDRQGNIYPMRGSHSTMLAKLYAFEKRQTMDEFYDSVPKKYYFDMDYYTSKGTAAISVRYDCCQGAMLPNARQLETIRLLVTNKLIKDKYIQLHDPVKRIF